MNSLQINDNAIYDTIFIINRLEKNFMYFPKDGEINFYCYLACLMSIFDKKPYAEWGYGYHLTNGELSSIEVIDSINYLSSKNLIEYEPSERGYKLNRSGNKFLSLIDSNHKYKSRRHYLKNSADLVILSNQDTLLKGIYANVDLSDPYQRSTAKPVLSEFAQTEMYNSLNEISLSIGIKKEDLIISTLSWINYKAEERRLSEAKG